MSLDAPLRKVAKAVLGSFGSSMALRRVTGSAYNPTTQSMAPLTTDTTVKGRLDEYTDRQLSDTIKAGDRKLIIAAADIPYTPTIQDKVVIGGIVWSIIRIQPQIATDQAAAHVLQLRR